MGIAVAPFVLVIVFQIHVADFSVCAFDAKRQAPVARDAQAPRPLAVAGQHMGSPGWQRAQFLRILHVVEECQHLTEFVHRIGGKTLGVTLPPRGFSVPCG